MAVWLFAGDGKIEMPFRCGRCRQDFSALNDLSMHVISHVGEIGSEQHGHAVSVVASVRIVQCNDAVRKKNGPRR